MNSKLHELKELIHNAPQEALLKSRANVHADGLYSIVFEGTENGRLKRAFIATKDIDPFDIQLHTHCHPLMLTTLKGSVRHHKAMIRNSLDANMSIDEYTYRSALRYGEEAAGLVLEGSRSISLNDYLLPHGSSIYLKEDDIHTVSCDQGSIWVVEELGFRTDESKMYGVPFETITMYQSMEHQTKTLMKLWAQLKDAIDFVTPENL